MFIFIILKLVLCEPGGVISVFHGRDKKIKINIHQGRIYKNTGNEKHAVIFTLCRQRLVRYLV